MLTDSRMYSSALGLALLGLVSGANAAFITFDAPGAYNTYVFGVNNAGQAVGTFDVAGGATNTGFIRDADGTFVTFTVPGSTGTTAWDINNNGDVVGEISTSTGQKGFIRTGEGAYEIIEIAGADGTEAQGINDLGEVVGSYYENGSPRGFFRDASGAFTLFDFPGASYTDPQKLNNSGVIVGATDWGGSAFFGTLANGFAPLGFEGLAMGINADGDIVGRTDPSAFFRDATGAVSIFSLGDPTGFYDINDLGMIGGTVGGIVSATRGLLGTLESESVGAVPEPSSIALLALGIAGLGFHLSSGLVATRRRRGRMIPRRDVDLFCRGSGGRASATPPAGPGLPIPPGKAGVRSWGVACSAKSEGISRSWNEAGSEQPAEGMEIGCRIADSDLQRSSPISRSANRPGRHPARPARTTQGCGRSDAAQHGN